MSKSVGDCPSLPPNLLPPTSELHVLVHTGHLLCSPQLLFLSPWGSFHFPHLFSVVSAFPDLIHPAGLHTNATPAETRPIFLRWCVSPSCGVLQIFLFLPRGSDHCRPCCVDLHLPPRLWNLGGSAVRVFPEPPALCHSQYLVTICYTAATQRMLLGACWIQPGSGAPCASVKVWKR